MRAEDQINMLKQIPPISNLEKRLNRRRALVLAVASMISVLFFVYAMLQKQEADKQFVLAEQRRMESEGIRVELEKIRGEADMAKKEAMFQRAIAEEQRMLAEQALENCKKSKHKY